MNQDKPIDKYPRTTGAVITALGLTAIYFFLGRPLMSAQAGEASISISMKGSLIAIMFTVLGLLLLALGKHFVPLLKPEEGKLKAGTIVLIVFLAAAGIGAYLALEHLLAGYGYTSK
ncbi:MAG: hypothetical protein OIF35_01925 [Cellvibrionaceae bacterium]|nr:hypothetical protein [Cellvibrionaceae bacterium]MCV6625749.1 hypothetical protein [Cellvibrionaceae bacterium]